LAHECTVMMMAGGGRLYRVFYKKSRKVGSNTGGAVAASMVLAVEEVVVDAAKALADLTHQNAWRLDGLAMEWTSGCFMFSHH